MQHPIARYLTVSGVTQAELARRAALHPARICDVLKGRLRRFTPEAAKRIAQATNGAVTLEELLFFRPAPRRRRARGGR